MLQTFRYSLLAVVLFISIKLTVFLSHSEFSGIGVYTGLISLFLLCIPLFLGIKHKRDHELAGYITIRQVMVTGIAISAMSGLLIAAYTFIHYKYIDMDVIEHWVSEAKRLGVNEHKSEAEIEQAIVMLKEFYSPFKQATVVLTGVLGVGTVMTFILSTLLVKRDPAAEN